MDTSGSKLVGGLLLLVAVWIVVYWAWTPSEAGISLGRQPDAPIQTLPIGTVPSEPDSQSHSLPPVPKSDEPVRTRPEGPGIIAPEFETYRVQPGDTLASISRRFYGTTSKTGTITRANPFKDPLRLKPGDELKIPKDPSNIQGKPAPAKPEPKPEVPGNPGALDDATHEYEVRPGDSLSTIAEREMGSSKYADLIYKANRDTLKSKDALKVGQKLTIPPKPAE
jgi:nucleoid-associated protein YgaU